MDQCIFCVLLRRRQPRSTLRGSSAASDVYKRQLHKYPYCSLWEAEPLFLLKPVRLEFQRLAILVDGPDYLLRETFFVFGRDFNGDLDVRADQPLHVLDLSLIHI